MRYAIILTLPTLALSLLQLNVSAQPVLSRLTIAFSAGGTIGGPNSDIEAHMRASGFGVTDPGGCFFGFCSGPSEFPHSGAAGGGLGVSLDYQLGDMFTASLYYSHRGLGETDGNASEDFGGLLFLRKSISSLESVLYVGPPASLPPRLIAVGVGFGVYRSIISDEVVFDEARFANTGVGAVASLVSRIPWGRFFIEGRFSYRLIPNSNYGPFEVEFVDQLWTMPQSKVSFSGAEFAFGVGFRMGGTR